MTTADATIAEIRESLARLHETLDRAVAAGERAERLRADRRAAEAAYRLRYGRDALAEV